MQAARIALIRAAFLYRGSLVSRSILSQFHLASLPPTIAMHRQIIVKVNVPVDEGIAPLVVALNRLPSILTVTSCERAGDGRAQVAFTLLDVDAQRTADYLRRLSCRIGATNGDLPVSLTMEWFAGGENALAWIRIPSEQTKALAATLESVADSWAS